MVYYVEKADLKYPSSAAEYKLLNIPNTDEHFGKFDESKMGKKGCPLRYPANEEEWKIANISSIFILVRNFG